MSVQRLQATRSVDEVKKGLLSLFPPGRAFSGHNTQALIAAIAKPRQQLEEDIAQIPLEICPGTSVQCLHDYQKVLGPDPFGRDQGNLSDDELRKLLQSRWTFQASQTPESYIKLAKSFGTEITIEEPEPPVFGDFRFGDGHRFGDISLRFKWIVHLPFLPEKPVFGAFVFGDGTKFTGSAKDPYSMIKRVFEILKPADTEVYFVFDRKRDVQ